MRRKISETMTRVHAQSLANSHAVILGQAEGASRESLGRTH